METSVRKLFAPVEVTIVLNTQDDLNKFHAMLDHSLIVDGFCIGGLSSQLTRQLKEIDEHVLENSRGWHDAFTDFSGKYWKGEE